MTARKAASSLIHSMTARVVALALAATGTVYLFAGGQWVDNKVTENRTVVGNTERSEENAKALVAVAQAAEKLTTAVGQLQVADTELKALIEANRTVNSALSQQVAVLQSQMNTIDKKIDKIGDRVGVP